MEPDHLRGGDPLEADIVGNRQGEAVDFTKAYRSQDEQWSEPIDYVGKLAPDGNSISGVWSLQYFNGTFEMYREAMWEEEQEREEALVVPLAEAVEGR